MTAKAQKRCRHVWYYGRLPSGKAVRFCGIAGCLKKQVREDKRRWQNTV